MLLPLRSLYTELTLVKVYVRPLEGRDLTEAQSRFPAQ
jgi:hypothetical protein